MKTSRVKEGYGIIQREIMCLPNISALAKSTYALLVAYAGEKEYCFPSMDVISENLNLSYPSVKKYLNELEKIKLVEVERHTGFKNIYWPKRIEIPTEPLSKSSYSGYGIIQKEIMCHKNISAMSKAVYALLISHTGIKGSCFPKIESMTSYLLVSKPTIIKSIKQLEGLKLLSVHRNHKKVNVYYPMSIVHDTESEVQYEYPFDSEKFHLVWDEWIAYRKEIKKPYKSTKSIQRALNQLKKFDERFALQLIDRSIVGGYQGLVFSDTPAEYERYKKENNTESTTKRLPFKW